MLSSNSSIAVLIVDGQHLFAPNTEAWRRLESGEELDAYKLFEPARGASEREFANRHADLNLVIEKSFSSWLRLVLVDLGGNFQRVHLEYLTCDGCGWKGWSGNPWVPDLYVGSPEMDQALQRAYDLELLDCPRCGEKLPRASIWTEPLSKTE